MPLIQVNLWDIVYYILVDKKTSKKIPYKYEIRTLISYVDKIIAENLKLRRVEMMNINIKAANIDIEMESGNIELSDVDGSDLIKSIKKDIGIDKLFNLVFESLTDDEFMESVEWIDTNHDFNCMICELDDVERQKEILNQLKNDLGNND